MLREAALELLYKDSHEAPGGKLVISKDSRTRSLVNMHKARKAYETAMVDFLYHDLAFNFRIAILGSARLPASSPEFQHTADLAKALVESRPKHKIDIVTGGGPGIMLAGHLGVHRAQVEAKQQGKKIKSKNHGFAIELPFEQETNKLVHVETKHMTFPTRILELYYRTYGAYHETGGYGTLLEALSGIQERQVQHLPGSFKLGLATFWTPILDTINDELYHKRLAKGREPLVSESDLKIPVVTDNVDDIVNMFTQEHDEWVKRRNLVRKAS